MSDVEGERSIFERAVEHHGDARDALLAELCAGDPELLERMRKLLAAHDRAQRISTTLHKPEERDEDDPRAIGPYKILERVGEGGMGIVFLAEQSEPIRRRVALKIIKLGMDTKEVMARFDSERQALALMNHPSIARILDAGATERGRPYFVMEHVPGISIIAYCDRAQFGTVERLRLFVQVAHAVQHAHQKGVIHRDLKPSNVLVTEEHGLVLPKVIDFGVAKATHQQLSHLTVHTGLGRLIGTPGYMSPEQAEMTALDVDTRSDVYSLGVLLYELLTGSLPFELTDKSPLEIQRILHEEDPEPPSNRLRKLGANAETVARKRGTSVSALRGELRGDLDQVILTALSRDRRRRYQTALALADDIERFLNYEPVHASSPSKTYRLAKFVRRHRVAVGMAAFVVALVVSLVSFYTVRLADERDRANRAAERATQEAQAADQVAEFLVSLFAVSDPSETRGNTVTAREILDEGADRILDELQGQPEVQAKLMDAIGRVYLSLGLYGKAMPLLESALEVRQRTLGNEHPDVAHSLNWLGEASYLNGDLESAEDLLREALALRRRVLGDDHPDVAQSLNDVGAVLWATEDYAQAESFYREALELRKSVLGDKHPDVAQSLNNLAVLLHMTGDFEAAEPLYRETLELRKEILGDDHPDTINSMNNLGVLLNSRGDPAAAIVVLRPALALRRRVLGNEHPETVESLIQLGRALRANAEYDEAEALFREALTLRRSMFGNEHRYVANSHLNLARILNARDDREEATSSYVAAIEIYEKTLGPGHRTTARARSEYGECLTALGRYPQAEEQLLAGYNGLKAGAGERTSSIERALRRLIALYEAWGMPEKAATYQALLD